MTNLYAQAQITVYAAASLSNALDEIEQRYNQQNKLEIKRSYAASSTLAKQIEAGAPANLFISADEQWMDYLQQKKLLNVQDRVNLLGNRLVVIHPKNQSITFKMEKSFQPSTAFQGKWCTGQTDSVPVGKYAKQALTYFGWWNSLKPRLVETSDVRAALNFVARGECAMGIVYATDAAISAQVKVAAVFPQQSHTAIIYPMGILKKDPATLKFYQYLQGSEAGSIFKKYGFSVLGRS
nr:molybdate ABC transporter substrate-binding protein [Acinetobacter larvae]